MAVLKKGDSFGDLSLLYGRPRIATIKTATYTDFIVMTKDIYELIVKSHDVLKKHKIVKFYLQFPLLQSLSNKEIL